MASPQEMYGKNYKLHYSPALAPAEALHLWDFDGVHENIKLMACLYQATAQ